MVENGIGATNLTRTDGDGEEQVLFEGAAWRGDDGSIHLQISGLSHPPTSITHRAGGPRTHRELYAYLDEILNKMGLLSKK